MVAHARAEAPLEACGLIAGTAPFSDGGLPTRWLPARNRLASPYRFEIHPEDLARHLLAIEAAGEVVWGIAHSHVRTPAVPSPTDLAGARWWPGVLWLLVSLAPEEVAADGAPALRAWEVRDGAAAEVPLLAEPRS